MIGNTDKLFLAYPCSAMSAWLIAFFSPFIHFLLSSFFQCLGIVIFIFFLPYIYYISLVLSDNIYIWILFHP